MESTQKILESMYDRLDNFMKTETVVGEPIVVDDVKIIPIISASFGLGGGFGEESKETSSGGGGGGVGGKITPDAMLVVKDGKVEMIPVKSKATLEKLIEKVPDLVGKLEDLKGMKEDKKEKEEEKEE
jgi:uncharacterized spore protein YtfJ